MRPGSVPARFVPRGVSDTLSGADSPAGACRALTNLVFDPSTPGVLQCRAAVTQLTDFTGFTTPAAISVAMTVGTRIYGMIASARFAGKDEPFIYDIPSALFIAITGVTAPKCPTTQPTTGDWTPPTMTMMGRYIIVTHPGFPGGVGVYFGWFDVNLPVTPAWDAGNTTTTPLVAVPVAVQQFNNRAYFAVGNTVVFTDTLSLTVTSGTQALTMGDSTPILALAPMPLSTTQQGILQAILPFKSNFIYQITGDATTSDLAVNEISHSNGTRAPRSIVPTPFGIPFVDSDGLRVISYSGFVNDPDPDLALPFIKAVYQSRISAGYNAGVYRICTQNGNAVGSPFQEYWFDVKRRGWTGPHPLRQDIAIPYDKTFVVFDGSHPAKMYRSDVVQTVSSSFTEFGTAMQFLYATAPIGEPSELFANSAINSTIAMAYFAAAQTYLITASDVNDGVVAQASIVSVGGGVVWNAFTWGAAIWNGQSFGLTPINIPWTKPLVFTSVVVQVAGPCSFGFKIGALKMLFKVLNYIP